MGMLGLGTRRMALAAAALVGAGAVAQTMAAPEPSPVPRRWQLDVRPGELRATIVETEKDGPRAYLYMTYLVMNPTQEDVFFAPTFEMATDEGDLIRSGRGVPREVTLELLRRLENPLLEDEVRVIRMLGQGEENAREGLVVWPLQSLKADEIRIFAAGFSGETRTIRRPDTDEEVTLRKTLMLRYATPGYIPTDNTPLTRVERRWIMR